MAVGAEDGTFGGFGKDAVLAPVHLPEGGVDGDLFLAGVIVVEFKAGGMILAATRALKRGLEFGKPSAEGAAALLIPLDLSFGVPLVSRPHVAALVFTTFFGIFERHWVLPRGQKQ
jgi:hypothetical protein